MWSVMQDLIESVIHVMKNFYVLDHFVSYACQGYWMIIDDESSC